MRSAASNWVVLEKEGSRCLLGIELSAGLIFLAPVCQVSPPSSANTAAGQEA